METRKEKEKDLHNVLRNETLKSSEERFEYLTSNKKWYTITKSSRTFIEKWLSKYCPDKRVLDYCCGNGGSSIRIAKLGASEVVGIDISDVSVENAKRNASQNSLSSKCNFLVMDAEKMEFDDNYFDMIYESGALHHLNLEKA